MSGRPKHVATLSDKISGLKFMQRAKAVAEQARSEINGQSSTNNAEATTSKLSNGQGEGVSVEPSTREKEQEEEDTNEEHWTLPLRDTPDKLKREASASSFILHEPGWNAWLLEADDGEQVKETERETSAIKVYGAWRKRAKRRQSEDGISASHETKRMKSEGADEEAQEPDISEGNSDANDSDMVTEDRGRSGFIKPGSLQKKDKSKKQRRSGDQTSQKKEYKAFGGNQRDNHTSGREKQKGNGRPLLSGFSQLGRTK